MALQGTLDTFALADVLRLLDSTNKTGCLRLEGTEGDAGSLHLDRGAIVAGSSTRSIRTSDSVEVLFDLLRLDEGSFVFEPDAVADDPHAGQAVEDTLVEAEEMLLEWFDIVSVVPTLDCWVKLIANLGDDEIIISSDRWRTIAAVGGGTTVRQMGETLELGEVAVSRSVKDLVEAGLAVVDEDTTSALANDGMTSFTDVLHEGDDADEAPGCGELSNLRVESAPVETETFETDLAPVPEGTVAGLDRDDAFLMDVFPGLAGQAISPSSESNSTLLPPPPTSPTPGLEQADADDDSADERNGHDAVDAVDVGVDDDDDEINRGMLLKFLGSVSS